MENNCRGTNKKFLACNYSSDNDCVLIIDEQEEKKSKTRDKANIGHVL